MSLRKQFKTSQECETKGVCLDYGDGQRIWVARAGRTNPAFQKEAQRVFRKYRTQLKHGTLPEEVQQKISYETYAKCVVIRWEGVREEDIGGRGKKVVPCTVENCIKLFENLPGLFDDIQAQAQDAQLFLESVREDDAKN